MHSTGELDNQGSVLVFAFIVSLVNCELAVVKCYGIVNLVLVITAPLMMASIWSCPILCMYCCLLSCQRNLYVHKLFANCSVFKDGGREAKKKDPTTSTVKCYFVRVKSYASVDEREPYILMNKSIYDARSLFMHAHTTSSLDKFMARYCTL